jgi:N-formylglutamate deformylase
MTMTNSTVLIDVPKFKFRQGRAPLLVSMPHVGTHIPADIASNMTEAALKLPDTDWHLEQLYDFLDELGASVLVATHSRYVIDLNRPSDNANLYPGQDTTGLCPIDTFHKDAIYRAGALPDEAEIRRRVDAYWTPYHAKLSAELQRIRAEHGIAMLWDAHSICSVVPRFFEGRLTDFNIGTASGTSCAPQLGERLLDAARHSSGHSAVLNGRFKGGHITRHYGKPQQNIHAVQLELAEATYMQEDHPYRFDETLANGVRPALRSFIELMLNHASNNAQR